MLGLVLWLYLVAATPLNSEIFSDMKDYSLANKGNVAAHDPNILWYNDDFYLFKGGVNIPFFRASQLDGLWEKVGTVLDNGTIIEKQNRRRPWAPMVTQWRDRFYLLAIGFALSDSIRPGSWTDHGAIINSGNGTLSSIYLYNVSNAIDPAFFADPSTGKPYLQYGSYWGGIFQLSLTDNLTVENPTHLDMNHLVYLPNASHGQCCEFSTLGYLKTGSEYSICVGRSMNVSGLFVDCNGADLLEGGGSVVYSSNHEEVYAPGGPGILARTGNDSDVLYYRYCAFSSTDARLGWNYLDYEDG
ncbi:glycosyl hydrolase [Aspergillus crustosus]